MLNARPEDRRAIIEEAAGILKFRKRKEKAERRLEATEGNLLRLTDLLREVRRQLTPLERQADAARRHDGLVEELRAIRLHLAGREIAGPDRAARLPGGEAGACSGPRRRPPGRRPARLEAEVAESEAALSDLPADSLGDAVATAESLLARARGLGALVAEKRRNIDRSLAALADAGVVETLTAEAAKLRADLAGTDEERLCSPPPRRDRGHRGDPGRTPGRARPGRRPVGPQGGGRGPGRADGAGRGLARTEAELSRLEGRREPVQRRLARLAEEEAAAGFEEFDEAPLVAALESARLARESAEAEAASADEARRSADADVHRWTARADALDAALGDLRAGLSTALEGVGGCSACRRPDHDRTRRRVRRGRRPGRRPAGRGRRRRRCRAARPLARLRSSGTAGTVLVPDAAATRRSAYPAERQLALPAGVARWRMCRDRQFPGPARSSGRLASILAVVVRRDVGAGSVGRLANPGADRRHAGRGPAGRPGGLARRRHRHRGHPGRRRKRPVGGPREAGEARRRAEATLAQARTALDEARRWEAAGDKALTRTAAGRPPSRPPPSGCGPSGPKPRRRPPPWKSTLPPWPSRPRWRSLAGGRWRRPSRPWRPPRTRSAGRSRPGRRRPRPSRPRPGRWPPRGGTTTCAWRRSRSAAGG